MCLFNILGNDTDGSEMRPSESFIRKFQDAKETKIGDCDNEESRQTEKSLCSKKEKKKRNKPRRFFFQRNKKNKNEDNISIHSQDTVVVGSANLDGEDSVRTIDYDSVTEASPALESKQQHEEEDKQPRKKKKELYKKKPSYRDSAHKSLYHKQQSQKSSSSEEPYKSSNGDDDDLKSNRFPPCI